MEKSYFRKPEGVIGIHQWQTLTASAGITLEASYQPSVVVQP